MDPTGPTSASSTGPEARQATCDSCGGPDDRLAPVHRVYLDLDEFGELWGTKVMPDTEWWCPACCATYPNEPAAGPGS